MNVPRHPFAAPSKGLLIDANLLSVVLIGLLGRGEIERFKRTRSYTGEDALAIDGLVGQFGWVCTTPHVIAEVSNLLDWLDQSKRTTALSHLAAFAQSSREIFSLATEIVRHLLDRVRSIDPVESSPVRHPVSRRRTAYAQRDPDHRRSALFRQGATHRPDRAAG